jgi:hypothetical protein
MLDVVFGTALDKLRRRFPSVPDGEAVSITAFEGSRKRTDEDVRATGRHQTQGPGRGGLRLDTEGARAFLGIYGDIAFGASTMPRVRIGMRPSDLPGQVHHRVKDEPIIAGGIVHVGLGLARLSIDATIKAKTLGPATREWHQSAATVDGYAVVESAQASYVDRNQLPWLPAPLGPDAGRIENQQRLLASLRAAWDPKRLFNPGRVPF